MFQRPMLCSLGCFPPRPFGVHWTWVEKRWQKEAIGYLILCCCPNSIVCGCWCHGRHRCAEQEVLRAPQVLDTRKNRLTIVRD